VRQEVHPDGGWAATVARRAAELISGLDSPRICLPTGNTVAPVYAHLASLVDWTAVTVFVLDEFGGLPPGDPGRCESLIGRHLIDLIDDPPVVHVPDVDPPDPDGYRALVADGGLDLAIVGLGANGHIGMNEPGSPATSVTRVVDLAPSTSDHSASYGATIRPTWGVTLGMDEILAARELWLVVSGTHKREVLTTALSGPVTPDLPASLLRDHPNLVVFADASASGA
jgi:glucosamine-6-phosphate deaminase